MRLFFHFFVLGFVLGGTGFETFGPGRPPEPPGGSGLKLNKFFMLVLFKWVNKN
jgi:hypothetical protein